MIAAVASLPMPLDSALSVAARRNKPEQAQDRAVHDRSSDLALQEQRRQLDQFLAGVERRALRMAEFAVRNRDDALEIVQDAMMKLAQSYGQLTPTDWPPLFQRILQSRITDHFRRQKVRNRVFVWFSRNDDEDDYDPIAEAPDESLNNPLDRLSLEQGNTALVEAVASLPERQRQAFLLRHWEGLSEKETAYAMQCSEGSVKTHLSRAMHALRARLAEHA
jgi:RNA polymerase sigma-70 factor, ECF subfamily